MPTQEEPYLDEQRGEEILRAAEMLVAILREQPLPKFPVVLAARLAEEDDLFWTFYF